MQFYISTKIAQAHYKSNSNKGPGYLVRNKEKDFDWVTKADFEKTYAFKLENGKSITENTDAEPEPGSGSDSNIPGSDWRTYRAYSEDLHLDDKGALIFCLSPLDNRNGYAVYDSANGARVGTLLWGSEKEADWQAKAQMEDLDHDGIKEIGISMADGEILWYHYREGLEDTWPENKCGCFEKVD